MIGSDVIDLGDPETRAVHPRFEARVLAPSERERLAASADPWRLRWVLWAAKEAAYKAARKIDPHAVFSPSRFVVERGASEVVWNGRRFRLDIEEGADFVHAVASAEGTPAESILRGAAASGVEAPGAAVRRFALETLAPLLGVAPEDLEIVREVRIPRLRARGGSVPVDLSLSHHGRYVAFAASRAGGWA